MSAIEIYNEKVRDLLKDGTERQNLPLLDDPERGTVAEGLSEEWPRSEQHLCQLLRQIEARRTVSPLIVTATMHTLTAVRADMLVIVALNLSSSLVMLNRSCATSIRIIIEKQWL